MTSLPCTWDGEALVPAKGHGKRADAALVIGSQYVVTVEEPRSHKQHARFFAMVNEYYHTLPEDAAADFPSSEHLRKHALCRTGFCDTAKIVCATDKDALNTAILAKKLDGYCVVSVDGRVVTIHTAHSMATSGPNRMDKERFKAASDAVLTWIEQAYFDGQPSVREAA